MSNLFIKENDEIKITIYTSFDKENKIYAEINKNYLEELGFDQIKEYEFIFKKPNYKDIVNISQNIYSDGKNVSIDVQKERYQRFIVLLKNWSLTDENNNPIPVTKENIDVLNPIVAQTVMNALESKINI